MSCAACNGSFGDDEESLCCTEKTCGKKYHVLCTCGRISTENIRESWICPECCCAAKKGGDNSMTPVGSTKKSRDRDSNVTFRKKASVTNEILPNQLGQELLSEMRELRCEVLLLKNQLSRTLSTITTYETKLQSYDFKLANHEALISKYEVKITNYASEVNSLNAKLKTYSHTAGCLKTKSTQTSQLEPLHIVQPKPVDSKPTSPSQSTPKRQTKSPIAQVQKQGRVELVTQVSIPKLQSNSGSPNRSLTTNNVELISAANTLNDDQQWIEAKRKNRKHSLKCGAAGPAVTELRAVEARKHIHLWNMVSGIEEVREYVNKLCPNGSCTVVELTAKGDYKSYKIGVPVAYFDTCYSEKVWPVNARIKPWVNYGGSVKRTSAISKTGPPPSPSNFRERPSNRATSA